MKQNEKQPKIKRKMWINSLSGKLEFKQIISAANEYNLDVLEGFKPSMMVDIHLGIKGTKFNIDNFKAFIKANGHEYKTRCPRRSFKFDI